MQRPSLVFANSVDYARHTGGWVYNSRVMQGLAALGADIVPLDLPAGFPRPEAAAAAHSGALLAALPDGTIVVADQICLSPLASIVERESQRLRLVMIFHHPIAKEEGLLAAERERFADLERQALAACRLVIATSASTAATLVSDYGVALDRIVVAAPGLDPLPPSTRLTAGDVPRLMSVGAVIERKGYHVLVAALSGLRDRTWHLDIVGDLERAPAYVDALRAQIFAARLDGRVVLRGGVDAAELEAYWRAAHLYVAASFHEGYGMAVAEAISRGMPTVTTRAGAVGDWLDPTAAIIVRDGGTDALSAVIAEVLDDPALREALRSAGLAQASRLPTWDDTARTIAARLAALFQQNELSNHLPFD